MDREQTTITPASFANRRTRVLKAAERLVFGPPPASSEARKLQKRYQKRWDRKITGGYRSDAGAERGGIFSTVLRPHERTYRVGLRRSAALQVRHHSPPPTRDT